MDRQWNANDLQCSSAQVGLSPAVSKRRPPQLLLCPNPIAPAASFSRSFYIPHRVHRLQSAQTNGRRATRRPSTFNASPGRTPPSPGPSMTPGSFSFGGLRMPCLSPTPTDLPRDTHHNAELGPTDFEVRQKQILLSGTWDGAE